jgi:hypothetical protein
VRAHPAYLWLFLLVVAPVGAAVIVAALLLFGVTAHTVFRPGFAVLGFLRARGVHAPNAVGVLTTVGMWWAVIVALGLTWERIR